MRIHTDWHHSDLIRTVDYLDMLSIRTTAALLFLCAAIAAVGYFFWDEISIRANERGVRSLVEDFGERMQKVSLLSPDAPDSIASEYRDFVSPALIALWQSDPSKAPGRTTSSPWPDRIEITQMVPQGAGYLVQGALVFLAEGSEESAGITPVYIQVVRESGEWKIVAYQEVVDAPAD